MTIYAKQVPPELQESPFSLDNYYLEDCAIFGNDHFYSHGLDCLEAIPEDELDELDMIPERLAAALTRHTGHPWSSGTLRGCCQSDWQHVIYRADFWSADSIRALEIEYFNLGTEWLCTGDPDNGDEVSVYCYGCWLADIADEIRAAFGCSAADRVNLDSFDGYTQTPKYRRCTF